MKTTVWRRVFVARLLRRQSLFVFVLVFVGSALSAVCQNKEPAVIQANHEIGVSFAPSVIAYREYALNGSELDSEHGWVSGVGVKASTTRGIFKVTDLLLEAKYDFNQGSSKHWSEPLGGSGSVLQYPAPFRSNDVSLAVGMGFTPVARLFLAAEAQSEYREWHRELPKAGLAVQENYTFWAPGGAVSASYSPFAALVMKGKAGASSTVSPTTATIGNASKSVPNLTFSLGRRPVWQADLGADWIFSRRVHAVVEIDYLHFGFGRSSVQYFGTNGTEQEPSSVTDLVKLGFGLAWSF